MCQPNRGQGATHLDTKRVCIFGLLNHAVFFVNQKEEDKVRIASFLGVYWCSITALLFSVFFRCCCVCVCVISVNQKRLCYFLLNYWNVSTFSMYDVLYQYQLLYAPEIGWHSLFSVMSTTTNCPTEFVACTISIKLKFLQCHHIVCFFFGLCSRLIIPLFMVLAISYFILFRFLLFLCLDNRWQ